MSGGAARMGRDFLRLALRNLRRNRRRTLATTASIALGFAAMVLLGGYLARVDALLRTNTVYLQHLGHVAVFKTGGLEGETAKPAQFALSKEEQATIRDVLKEDPAVEIMGPYLKGSGLAGNGCRTTPFYGLGVDVDVERVLRSHPRVVRNVPEFKDPKVGLPLSQGQGNDGEGIWLAEGLAQILGKKRPRSDLTRPDALVIPDCASKNVNAQIAADANVQLAAGSYTGSFSAVDAEVAAIFSTGISQTNDFSLLAPLGLMQRLYDTDAITYFSVFLKDDDRAPRYARDLRDRLRARGLDVETHSFRDPKFNEFYTGTTSFLDALGIIMGTIVNIVVALSVANAMTMTVLERTREIGTLRAVGFKRFELILLFVVEAVLMSIVGCLAGALLAEATSLIVNGANIMFEAPTIPGRIRFLLTPTPVRFVGVGLMLSVIAGLATIVVVRRRISMNIAVLIVS